jgi:hypothetical protein
MENVTTVEGCEDTIARLSDGIAARDRELEELIAHRSTLIEDAALNLNGAQKLLSDADKQIDFRTKDREIKRQAIQSVSKRLERAKEVLAREEEKQRSLQMGEIARQILTHAEAYSVHLRDVARAGDAIRDLVRKMHLLATPGPESQWLNRLNETGPYLRAAEHAGIRNTIPITPYSGPRHHVVSLDQHMRLILDRWIVLAEPEAPQKQEPASTQETESQPLLEAAEQVN